MYNLVGKALEDLKEHFPAEGEPFVEFQWSIREDHDMCMKEELDMSTVYKENIYQFEMHRKFLDEVFGLNQTLKMHVIKYHYVTYFKMMGQTRNRDNLLAGFPESVGRILQMSTFHMTFYITIASKNCSTYITFKKCQ